jgi:predicted lipid-binding transport protein (Tim44 family)
LHLDVFDQSARRLVFDDLRIAETEISCSKMKKLVLLMLAIGTLLLSSLSWARGGGGCVVEGTPVLTPSGPVPIERLQAGDRVWSLQEGMLRESQVHVQTEIVAQEILEISAGGEKLKLTPEHPVMTDPGEYRMANRLKTGDTVYMVRDGLLKSLPIQSLHCTASTQQAYNLQVSPGGTFVAGGLVVHNKGCFLPESQILKTDGTEIAISSAQPGDKVLAFTTEGRLVRTQVRDVVRTEVGQYVILQTDRVTLRVTEDHPFYVGGGTFKTLEVLKPGDTIMAWDGQSLTEQKIVSLQKVQARVPVFNLQTDHPNTFFAGHIAVHNKGGGGGGGGRSGGGFRSSSSSRSSSGSSGAGGDDAGAVFAVIFLFVFILFFIFVIRSQKGRKSENLDFVYDRKEISRKAEKTEKLLAFVSQQDQAFSPEALRTLAQSTFLKLQECWQSRDYTPMKPLLMPALFAQQQGQVLGMVRNHEINRLEDLKVERVDLVHVRYTEKKDQREFTALITASARDTYVDDRTGKFLRGDEKPARFQEFWTFHFVDAQWLLREIEQAGESDILKDENFAEMLTDETVQGIYQEAAKEGIAGPWLPKGEEKKATRIERLLNFLVQTDKLWNRQQMLERVRQVFLSVYLARESGDPAQVPEADLFPEVAQNLRQQIQQWQSDRLKVEYRNLCVRKAELILVRNFTDSSKDEFTVRMDAHAQKIVARGDRMFSEQKYVTPFEEYWTFGRQDDRWKLKEALPPGRGKKMVTEENVDEESSAGQIEWYYRQSRAT